MPYDVGDAAALRHEVRTSAGTLTAATVALTVTDPSGTTSTPSVTTSSTGIYDATVTLDEAGTWTYKWSVSGTVTDVAHGQIVVGDPQRQLYVTLPEIRDALTITDTDRDALLLRALAAASRAIDAYTGRRFYADLTATARTGRMRGRVVRDGDGELLMVDDIATTTGLTVEVGDGTSWTTVTDYFSEPDNAIVRGQPITGLRRDLGHWSTARRWRVTARWGWPAIPDQVAQATLIQAMRLYKRKDSPEGVMGSADWGVVRLSRVDPDVQALISHLVLPGIG